VSVIDRILPQPLVSLVILGLGMVLAPTLGLGHLLLAGLLAIAIPWLTQSFWPNRPRLRRPLAGVALFIRVVGDIIVANWQVARLVLGPLDRLDPAFVEVPLDIADPFVATLLGSIVSLTPGTVSIEIDRDRHVLLVHGLDIEDEAAMIATVKARYETPLKEIFGC
jgi:multicomponent K+:H+ antiporter subunit E